MGGRKGASRGLVGKPERIRLLERPRCRGQDIIKMVFNLFGRAWTGLIWLRVRSKGGFL
jgi:hypothetical protein